MYKIRFHLAKGENHRHWQVKNTLTGEVRYYDPNKTYLQMQGCRLRNQPTTARKIHNGANKTVCAWVDCEVVEVKDSVPLFVKLDGELSYNPRTNPYWVDGTNTNSDNKEFDCLLTINRKIANIYYQF